MIAIVGGTVYSGDGFTKADVLVDGDQIVAVGQFPLPAETTVIDASGCLVGPGFVDVHVHFREPGQTWKEDVETGSRAAAAGGFTGVVAMPNTDPAIDTLERVDQLRARGEEVGLVEVMPAAALTKGRLGQEPTDVERLYEAGVRIFSDDGDSVADAEVLGQMMERIAQLPDAVVSQHAEDATMTGSGHMHEGDMSERLGVGGLPAEAETSIVERDLDLVAHTGAAYHCQHVSAAGTIELIRLAKDRGLPVTAEVTPHHLTFDEASLEGLSTDLKMYPPIRAAEDRTALREALNDGTIDLVATDHAPHSVEEKEVPFEDAPRGVIGLETAAAAVWEVVSDAARLFEVMSVVPALLGDFEAQGRPISEGEPANIVVFDPDERWIARHFQSKSSNSPFIGRSMIGRVRATVHLGKVTYLQEDEDE